MTVIDASAWVAVLGSDPIDAFGDSALFVPGHFDAEVLNALRGLVCGGRLTREAGAEFLDALRDAPLFRISVGELTEAAWPLAEAVSAYDALYVALARREDVALVTADARLARGASDLCEVRLLEP
jgi:predicted nucleic acid-binding protein